MKISKYLEKCTSRSSRAVGCRAPPPKRGLPTGLQGAASSPQRVWLDKEGKQRPRTQPQPPYNLILKWLRSGTSRCGHTQGASGMVCHLGCEQWEVKTTGATVEAPPWSQDPLQRKEDLRTYLKALECSWESQNPQGLAGALTTTQTHVSQSVDHVSGQPKWTRAYGDRHETPLETNIKTSLSATSSLSGQDGNVPWGGRKSSQSDPCGNSPAREK